MTQLLDIESKHWDSAKDGTIKEFQADSEIPVTVYLQWFEGGWNRIYEVRIGAVNAGSEDRALAEETFGSSSKPQGWTVANISQLVPKFAKDSLKSKSPYFSNVPIEFLERVPTLVAGVQRDIEGTRQAVQFIRDELKFRTSNGSLEKFWQDADNKTREIVAFKLKELLRQFGVHKNIETARELLNFKNADGTPISRRTFIRWANTGEKLLQFQANNKKGKK
jgi:hypothetical protein